MIPGVRCKACVYWVTEAANQYGQCHRYPPRPDVVEEDGEAAQRDVRPLTSANEWCGEWKGRVVRKGRLTADSPTEGGVQ